MAECDLVAAIFDGIEGGPYRWAFVTFSGVVLLTFVVSTLSKNYSQVDKLWSIIPVVYAWIPVCDARTLLMACLATIWGVRLTWNFNRRGGYTWPPWEGDEDYRWKILQDGGLLKILTNKIVWNIFNLVFTSFYQNVILLWIVAPSFVVYSAATLPGCSTSALGVGDAILAFLFLFFVIFESIADNQQFAFQTEKYRRKNAGEKLTGDYADGFCRSGLFSILRKPNYAAEQSIWVTYFCFSLVGQTSWWNWSGVGVVLLLSLFQGSGWLTEKITRSKYPAYDEYMKQVPLFVPNPFYGKGRKSKSS